ncbi:HAD family phosphatase [Paenibacillus hemerocallicola]|jgi:HAD superfamily hydrolase (TIGR01509 family)|uniref:HAD family phosphatase n=1 Tax=Paenibacillus hemerocallicola TaxID=1172614 RepID=A0A5C4T6B2_9BACL|nr:HAD family phosphatase [Paenibacillus hemerocallicola]TNJ64366.1 HAD family phosphatase [Paenibacillus hemerocallicola]
MTKGIIFDFDGVILDTETIDYKVMCQIYEEYGAVLPLDMWARRVGGHKNNFDPYEYLISCTQNNLNKNDLKKYKKAKYEQCMANERLLPGVLSCLQSAKRMNIPVSIASSSPRKRIVELLGKFNIIDYFAYIVSSEDVVNVKPHPDLYLKAVSLMNLEPFDVIAIEDSPAGARAAKDADIYCIIVPNEMTRRFTFQNVDLQLNSLQEMELPDLLNYVNIVKGR